MVKSVKPRPAAPAPIPVAALRAVLLNERHWPRPLVNDLLRQLARYLEREKS